MEPKLDGRLLFAVMCCTHGIKDDHGKIVSNVWCLVQLMGENGAAMVHIVLKLQRKEGIRTSLSSCRSKANRNSNPFDQKKEFTHIQDIFTKSSTKRLPRNLRFLWR